MVHQSLLLCTLCKYIGEEGGENIYKTVPGGCKATRREKQNKNITTTQIKIKINRMKKIKITKQITCRM